MYFLWILLGVFEFLIQITWFKKLSKDIRKQIYIQYFGSRAVDGKRFLESNASSIPGTYFRLGYVTLMFFESRKHSIRGTFYRQLPLIQYFTYYLYNRVFWSCRGADFTLVCKEELQWHSFLLTVYPIRS